MDKNIYSDNKGDAFGRSVKSPDSITLAIGSPGNLEENDWPGYMRVSSWASNNDIDTYTWNQIGQDIVGDEDGDEFGDSATLLDNGETLAVGAIQANGNNGVDLGHVRIYRMDDSESN
jgi:hypothetical protein